jgi:hypothetical protein
VGKACMWGIRLSGEIMCTESLYAPLCTF